MKTKCRAIREWIVKAATWSVILLFLFLAIHLLSGAGRDADVNLSTAQLRVVEGK